MRPSALAAALGLALGLCAVAQAGDVPPPLTPHFTEVTASAGIDSVYAGQWQYMVGGGVAVFDCMGNGFPDLLLAGGEGPAKFYRNISKRGGDIKFVEAKSGLELDRVTGAYPIDIDGDGIIDIVLLRVGGNMLMRGLGDCKFEPANDRWGFDGGDGWSTAFSATFEHGKTWPTLAIGNYINRKEEIEPWGTCTDNWLHRPLVVDGKPETKFAPPIALKPSFCPLSMLFTDWNRSGTPSLRVSNDREYYEGGQEQLWHVVPDQPPALFTEAEGWKPLRIWGMGIASANLDGSAYPSYFLTSMADNKLQTLDASTPDASTPDASTPETSTPDGKPQPVFRDIAFAKGVTAHRPYMGTDLRPSTGWHAQFGDVNNDGLVDLFIAKGNVAKMPDFAEHDPNNLLLQSADGKFHESGDVSGVSSGAVSRGAALADFNLDGLLDLVVVNRWQSAQVWQNVTVGAGHWLEVRIGQDGANRVAIGSWLEVKRADTIMRQEITIGGGHASGQLGWRHFGLGDATEAQLRVIWPDGTAGPWQSLAADKFYIAERDKPVRDWQPN